ncbi:MAG: hypothetical protein ACXWAT_10475 [Methylobacter sp.]
MPTLRFEGHSDDTFGEVDHFQDDYDNCASGKPISYKVTAKDDDGVQQSIIVTGQHGLNSAGWAITVENFDPKYVDVDFPRWPMRIEPQKFRNGYQPSLVIEAPEGVTIKCLQRHDEGED